VRFLGAAVIPAVVGVLGVLLVSSGVTPVRAIGPASVNPAPAGDAKPVVAGSRPAVQRSVLDKDRERDAALGLVLLLVMRQGRIGPVGSP
jgi:hypothetical protein